MGHEEPRRYDSLFPCLTGLCGSQQERRFFMPFKYNQTRVGLFSLSQPGFLDVASLWDTAWSYPVTKCFKHPLFNDTCPRRVSVPQVSNTQVSEVMLSYKQTKRNRGAKFIPQHLQILQKKHWPLPTQNNFHSMLWSWEADVTSLLVMGI